MKNLLYKELKLASLLLTYLFILFAFMTLIPGYPILVGVFFVCLGIFQSFRSARENNDILYTVLLPVKKSDAVKAKYIFAVFIEMTTFVLCLILTIIRMTVWAEAGPYVTNVLMNANQVYLAHMLIIFALFNWIFIAGFFKTAYQFSKPFITFIIVSFVYITFAEAIHFVPGLTFLNDTATMGNGLMWGIFAIGVVIYVVVTLASCSVAKKRFDKVDM